ncbi:MAG: protein YcaR in KDO2-Lipid A biosynthesis cluster [Acidimicrobiaceae bacterium]|nr:protein YcaR in KDO2-Lipid A biosynthesis cluster [Acidimicrobiaceae bacterium]
MAIDHELLKILACPEDKGELLYFEDENILYNPRIRRAYPIREGIPVLLISEAEAVTEEKHAELTRR